MNDRSQGAEDWRGNLLSICLDDEAEDKINEKGGGGDNLIEAGERVDQKGVSNFGAIQQKRKQK